jgi:hypothetical protein
VGGHITGQANKIGFEEMDQSGQPLKPRGCLSKVDSLTFDLALQAPPPMPQQGQGQGQQQPGGPQQGPGPQYGPQGPGSQYGPPNRGPYTPTSPGQYPPNQRQGGR